MTLQLIHHPTDLSGLGLGFRLALACRAEAQRHGDVCDWTAQGGRAHRQRRVLRLLFLVFKTHSVKNMHKNEGTEDVLDRFIFLHTHTHTLRVGCCQAACSCPFLSATRHRQQGSAAVTEVLGNPAGTLTHTFKHTLSHTEVSRETKGCDGTGV